MKTWTPGTVQGDPKPRFRRGNRRRRVVDPTVLRAFHASAPECVSCGRSRPVSAHHLISRAHGGDDVQANLVCLCGSGSSGCHGAYHGNPYTGDFGFYFTAHIVRDRISAYLSSEAGDDARAYVLRKFGATAGADWLWRNFEVEV